MNTSGITGLMGKLDFQFNPGSGTLAASVDISSFSSTGGVLTGSPTLSGGASGNLTSTVHIANSGGLNEYLQNFTFGTALQFQIFFGGAALTSPNGTSTDTFGLALYDASFNPKLNSGSQGDFIVTHRCQYGREYDAPPGFVAQRFGDDDAGGADGRAGAVDLGAVRARIVGIGSL